MYITINNIKIHYEHFIGTTRDTTVLLHGWGANTGVMRGIFNSLVANNKSVVMLDFPYFGLSEPPSQHVGIYEYAYITQQFILALNLHNINLIGHSFGARVAIILASDNAFKHNVNKLLLTGAAGLKPKRGIKYHYRVFTYKLKKRLGLKQKNAGSTDYAALPSYMRGVFVRVVNTHLKKHLPLIDAHTLLIWGQNDKDTPLYMANRMQRVIKGSALIILENAAHYAFLDNPIQFNAILNSFI